MPSADFWLITLPVAQQGAIGFHLICSYRSMSSVCPGLVNQVPDWLVTDRLLSRSPQIRACTVAALPHHLRWPLDHVASSSCADSPSAYASDDVLVHQLAVLRPVSFRPPSRVGPCHSLVVSTRWRYTRQRMVIFLKRTFTSLVHAHAGRTQGSPPDQKPQCDFHRVNLIVRRPIKGKEQMTHFVLKVSPSLLTDTVLVRIRTLITRWALAEQTCTNGYSRRKPFSEPCSERTAAQPGLTTSSPYVALRI